ncbi:MAG: pantetheine-phosphate adenylyltransferase [Actinobacteria bacterium]|nr:pantetheine-phosphate adenylyltransferase [Actinomycetota bacterium]
MTDSSSLIALYPGSFDPFHNGHLAVVTEVAELFGNVVVAVMHNPDKPSGLIPLVDRVQLARRCTEHLAGVRVEAFPGLAVQAAAATGANFIVKGLRTPGDFEVEQQMAHTNRSVTGIRTVYLPSRADQAFISSRFIREIAQNGGRIDHLVPEPVSVALAGIFGKPSGGDKGRS